MTGVSIIVCCYNSRARLTATLQHLHALDIVNIPCEVVLVDNNSTDDTASVAKVTWDELGNKFPLRVVGEPNAGLKYARERGIASTQSDYLVFCDDDNHLAADYIRRVYDTLNAEPAVAMIGGLGTAISSVPLPEWFNVFQNLYAVGRPVADAGPLSPGSGYIYGAGMAIRKEAWEKLGRFGFTGISVDRQGDALSGGNDVEISHAFRLIGYKVVFDDQLRFDHFIEPKRLSWPYVLSLVRGSSSNFTTFVYYILLHRRVTSTSGFLYIYSKRLASELMTMIRLKFDQRRDRREKEVMWVMSKTSFVFLLGNLHPAVGYFRHARLIFQQSSSGK